MEVIDHSSLNGNGGNVNAPTTTMTFSITASPHSETTQHSIKLLIASKSPNAADTMFTANVSLGGGGVGDGGDNCDGMHASVQVSSVPRHGQGTKRNLNRSQSFVAYSPKAKFVRSTSSVLKSPQQRKETCCRVATDTQTTEPFEQFEVQSTTGSHRPQHVILPAHAEPIVEVVDGHSSAPGTLILPRSPLASAVAPSRPPLVAHWSADVL